jgi:hypothetical protein
MHDVVGELDLLAVIQPVAHRAAQFDHVSKGMIVWPTMSNGWSKSM